MRKIRNIVLSLLLCFSLYGCGIYSFSGTSIQPDVKTIAVEYFQNNALKVNPTLAANLTDALIDLPPILRTRLSTSTAGLPVWIFLLRTEI